MSAEPPVVGIDLGTTNSLVAYVDPTGRPTCLPNFEGDVLTPSAVLIDEDVVIVGREARKGAPSAPGRYAECFKRFMGEDNFPNKVAGRFWRPELLSALVLRRLRNDVERKFGAAGGAVITVPAYFDECRRRATQDAGAVAGWRVADIINEPTAAAIAYAHAAGRLGKDGGRERVLVYDLGGGTFDTTVLEVAAGREYRTVATEGEVRLGGHDWDERLADDLAQQFQKKTGHDPRETAAGRVEFLLLAQKIKHTLSQKEKASAPCLFQGERALLEVTRQRFEALTADLLERSRETVEMVREQAKLRWEEIDKVLLTGGSTRMPMVGRMLEELTGKAPDRSLSADEAVAQGAAVYARLRGTPGAPRVVNVNAHSYRVICRNRQDQRVAIPLVPKNSPLPKSGTRLIPLQKPGQTAASIVVCEGESEGPDLCTTVGKVSITDLPKDASKRWVVAIRLTCRDDGNVEVDASARDPAAVDTVVRRVTATLEPEHGMTEAEVAEARRELERWELS